MAKMARNKTKNVLLALSEVETNRIGIEVERLIKNEMSFIVNKYVYKYKNATFETFGWDTDDLLQHIRVLMWRGVATFNPERKLKMTTYLSSILYYQMGNLSKKISSKKNSQSKLYCPEVFYDSEEMIDFTTAEDWLLYARKFEHLVGRLTDLETKVLVMHLIYGHTLDEMEEKLSVKRVDLIKSIKVIKVKMENF
jgi:DNA-directed RNA polymerase specialized sigma24 family protein